MNHCPRMSAALALLFLFTLSTHAQQLAETFQKPNLAPAEVGPQPGVAPQCTAEGAPFATEPCGCNPLWMFRVSGVLMSRARPNSLALVRDDTGATVVNADQIDFDYQPGIEIGLGYRLGTDWQLEFRYLGVHDLDGQAAGVNTTAGGSIGTTPPTPFVGGPAAVTFNYSSRLQSGEFNLQRINAQNWSVLAGIRVMELEESLDGLFQTATPFLYSGTVSNRMVGVQVGAQGTICTINDRFRLDAFGKVGALANFAKQNSAIGGGAGASAEASETVGSLAAETGLTALWRINRNWSLRASYEILWLDGVALAPDQLAATGNLTAIGGAAPTRLDQSDALFHGGFIGLEFAY